jgi:hypothetical protein
MGYAIKSLNSIFRPEFHPVEIVGQTWHLYATCYFNFSPYDYLKKVSSNDSNLLEFSKNSSNGGGVEIIDVNKINEINNPHLADFSNRTGLPLSVIFDFSIDRIVPHPLN